MFTADVTEQERLSGTRSFFERPYLTGQIIPYIGNKRKLLPLFYEALKSILSEGFRGKRFADLFAGSGSIARFAKYIGFEVYANDWEHYSYILNYAYIRINKRDLSHMYSSWGGTENIINRLNDLPSPAGSDEYIAKYFCPKDDNCPDYKTERLFYTRYNGLTIDKIRNEIELLYPEQEIKGNEKFRKEKYLLLAILIYQSATHTNTSGVFKAFHKGFGGFSKDALTRILKPISLQLPLLIDSDQPCFVYREDANLLVQKEPFVNKRFDVVYLDPPYNQHQYGSNYHLLNTIALWDKIELSETPSTGEKNRAGIRKDWIKTRSDFCYRDNALDAFKTLINRIDARFLLVSYSTEGIIPFQELIAACAERGKVRLFTNEYIKYRGGKQSITRTNNNIEFVIIIDTKKRTEPLDMTQVQDILCEKELNLLLKRSYSKTRLKKYFLIDEDHSCIGLQTDVGTVWIQTRGFFKMSDDHPGQKIDLLTEDQNTRKRIKRSLSEALHQCACRDRAEEVDTILALLAERSHDTYYFVSLIPGLLRKFAHKKYKNLFFLYLQKIRDLKHTHPVLYQGIEERLTVVERTAHKRFNG